MHSWKVGIQLWNLNIIIFRLRTFSCLVSHLWRCSSLLGVHCHSYYLKGEGKMKKQWVSIGGVVEIKVQILYTQDRAGSYQIFITSSEIWITRTTAMNPHRGKFPGIGTGCTLRYSSNFQESRVWLQAIYLICIRLYKGWKVSQPKQDV